MKAASMRLFLAILLLPVSAKAITAQYAIALHDRSADVRARFPQALEDSVTFTIRPWAGADFTHDIEQVAAMDLRGRPLTVESTTPGEWVVQNHHRPFQLNWHVIATKDAMLSKNSGSQFHATLLKDWVSLWGHSFILTPLRSALADAPVTVQMETNEYGHWDSTLPPNRTLPHLDNLTDQLFIAGAFRTSTQPGRRFYFATSQTVVPDRDLMEAVDKIFTAEARYMGGPPSRPPLLVFADGRSNSSGGTVVQNSAVFYPDLTQDLKYRNRAALRLIGHELFHLWNGGEIHHQHDAPWSDGKYGWFMEGFTEYYSGAVLFRERIFDAAEFSTFLNSLIVDYVQNRESLHATLDDLGSQYWRDRDHQRLPYTKGALLGLLLDLQLRRKRHTLDDYMRLMMRKPDYSLSDLRAAWLEVAGPGGAEFWDRFIPTAAPLPFAEIFQSAEVHFEYRDILTFSLGFTLDKPNIAKDANVLSVDPGSNAEKAGIQPGDSLQRFSFNNGDPGKEAKLGFLRGTEQIDVAYLPAITRKVIQITGGLEILR
jgi:predicted metalloprotease with PDZ domain